MKLVLGHGAGAGRDHPWMKRVVSALDSHGIETVTFNFPYIDAGRSTPDRPLVLEAHFEQVWKDAASKVADPMIAGGKSMGGRIASQVAGRGGFAPPPAALVFFGYPLHPPNQPGKRRDAHLPHVAAPMLFLHGTRDPFGSPDEMRELVASLPRATLYLIDGGDHSLVVRRARTSGASSEVRAQRSEPGGAPSFAEATAGRQGSPPVSKDGVDSVERAVAVAAAWVKERASGSIKEHL